MNIRQSLSQIMQTHSNKHRDIEQQRNTQLHILITKIQSTFTLLNKDMCITPDIQDFNVDCKDPSLILDLIVKMFALCNANIKENGLNSFDKLVERLIKLIHMQDSDKIFETSARMSIQIFDLKKKSVKLEHDILIVNEKLAASQEAYKSVVKKATSTIEIMKQEFEKVLELLKHNQELMLKLEGSNKRLNEEKSQLQTFIKDYKENMRNKKDPSVKKGREINVLKGRYQESLKMMEKQYKHWWHEFMASKK